MGPDMVKTMAHGMPDREGVHWAAQSADKVSDKLPPHEVQGMKAAQAWSKNPTPENQARRSRSGKPRRLPRPGFDGRPGRGLGPAKHSGGAGAAAAPRLTPHAVSGSVLMSAATKANPAVDGPNDDRANSQSARSHTTDAAPGASIGRHSAAGTASSGCSPLPKSKPKPSNSSIPSSRWGSTSPAVRPPLPSLPVTVDVRRL